MEQEREFSLTSIENDGTLLINSFEGLLLAVKAYVQENKVFAIQTKSDCTFARKQRAEINNKLEAIKRFRIDTVNDFVTEFNEQCKTIETLLDDLQKDYGNAIKAFTDSQKLVVDTNINKPKKLTATLKFYDEKIIEKLKQFAIENNCELTIKE